MEAYYSFEAGPPKGTDCDSQLVVVVVVDFDGWAEDEVAIHIVDWFAVEWAVEALPPVGIGTN